MMRAVEVLAWLTAAAWVWKLMGAARGLPQIVNLLAPEFDVAPAGAPSITVIVPARDEAADIAATLESLLAQDYDKLRIIAVDDRSSDATGSIMDSLAAQHPDRLTALHITELPAGWLGKSHAMASAARHAASDYLLFTDGDILFAPDAIRRSLARAVATDADHFVTFPTPVIESIGEGMLLGFLQVIGLWVTRPWRVDNPRATRDSVGIGAFSLMRTSAYQRLGGFEAIRMEILEDLTLARRVKLAGLRQRVAMAPGMVRVHWATGAFGIVDTMTKNLFAVFGFRVWLVGLTILWLALFCIAPVGFLFVAGARVAGLVSLGAVVALYVLSWRHSRISPWYAVFFPVSGALFIYSLMRSVYVTLRQGGVVWRGTFYHLDELRRNRVPD